MVTPAAERPADPRTNKQPARNLAPAELLQKIEHRRGALDAIAKRGDDRDGVLADLRAGVPVIVLREFKWDDEIIPRFIEWHPGYEFIPRLAEVMNASTYKRMLVTKAYHEAGSEVSRLNKIAQALAPLVSRVSGHKAAAAQARAEQQRARLAEIHARVTAEQAEESLQAADAELNEYISGLDLEI